MNLQNCKTIDDYKKLNIFDEQQLFVIEKSIEAGINTQIVADPKYKYAQMAAIAKLLKEGKDVDALTRYIFRSQHIPVIVFGINNNLNVRLYANPQFTHNQMWAIADGLYAGMDVSDYAKVTVSAKDMYDNLHIKLKLFLDKYGYDVESFNGKQMTIIAHGIKNGLEVYKYDKIDFSYKMMSMVVIGLENDVDVDIFLDKEFTEEQAYEIYMGLASNLNAELYASPEYTSEQMKCIRELMEKDVNVSDILNPKITV